MRVVKKLWRIKMNIYLTKEQTKVLKAILKQEQTAPTSTWHVDGKREFKHVDIILMKLNGGK
jgi:hypothetical protein